MRTDLQALRRLDGLTLRSSTPTGARFSTEIGELRVECYAPDIMRLRLTPETHPGTRDYGLLAVKPEEPPQARFSAQQGAYRLEAGELSLEVLADPIRVRLVRDGRPLLESTSDGHIRGGLRIPAVAVDERAAGPTWWVAFALRGDTSVYGLGEKFGPLNRRGQLITSWNEDALGVNSELSYKNAPFAWSPEGWGVFVHTTARVTHGVGYAPWSQRSYALRVDDPVLDLFFFAGRPPAIIERYTHLTGRTPLPPRWSYGAWMSRAWYRTAEEALDAARTLREHRIPCDVLTLDGRAWLKVETRFGFEWDHDRYPDPEAFIRELKALGFRLCLWEYPYVSVHNPLFRDLAARGYLLRTASGDPYVYEWDPRPFGTLLSQLPPSGMVDFTNPDAYAWYAEAHRTLFAQGVDVFKSDFGEQIPEDAVASNGDTGARLHNAYPLLYNRCVFEASERYAAGGALVWGRSGWTGSQRYPIQWGGDPQSDWEGLAASIRGGLSWGASGAPFYSHDIGGFYHAAPGTPPDEELYVRWTQAGVMTSHTRFHGTSPREPWHYGEEVERIVRRWLEWRYRLIPYLEACAFDAHRTGMPVMRAMSLAFPDDPAAWAFEHQYLLGPSLLVAPVLEPGGRARFYLPAGRWYELAGMPTMEAVPMGEDPRVVEAPRVVEGPRVMERSMPLDRMPVFGREGFLLTLGSVAQHTGEIAPSVQIDELWAFGEPQQGLEWPDLRVDRNLADLPQGTKVRRWAGP